MVRPKCAAIILLRDYLRLFGFTSCEEKSQRERESKLRYSLFIFMIGAGKCNTDSCFTWRFTFDLKCCMKKTTVLNIFSCIVDTIFKKKSESH